MALVFYPRGGHPLLGLLAGLIFAAMFLSVMVRIGFLSVLLAQSISDLLRGSPMSFEPNVWYAHSTIIAVAVVAVLAIYGFRTSLGGQSAFRDLMAEERFAS